MAKHTWQAKHAHTHTHTYTFRDALTWTSPKSLATFGADIPSRVPFALIFIHAL